MNLTVRKFNVSGLLSLGSLWNAKSGLRRPNRLAGAGNHAATLAPGPYIDLPPTQYSLSPKTKTTWRIAQLLITCTEKVVSMKKPT